MSVHAVVEVSGYRVSGGGATYLNRSQTSGWREVQFPGPLFDSAMNGYYGFVPSHLQLQTLLSPPINGLGHLPSQNPRKREHPDANRGPEDCRVDVNGFACGNAQGLELGVVRVEQLEYERAKVRVHSLYLRLALGYTYTCTRYAGVGRRIALRNIYPSCPQPLGQAWPGLTNWLVYLRGKG